MENINVVIGQDKILFSFHVYYNVSINLKKKNLNYTSDMVKIFINLKKKIKSDKKKPSSVPLSLSSLSSYFTRSMSISTPLESSKPNKDLRR